jgi:NAD(P)-dependent dehydrogenase (short-subunit alcohol dehydrogenase family)
MSHSPLHDYRILVTGGTSGLGRALVSALLARGARVAFVARHADAVDRTVTAFPASRGIIGDVARKEDIYPIALQALGVLGSVDVLINNASSLGPVPLAPLADTSCEDLELALLTNLVGPFRLTKALLGSLAASAREGRYPLVVNISSDAAITPYANWGAYGASKAALQHLSRIWDQELRTEDVRFLAIDPGDMDTPLHALAVPDADRTALKPPEAAAHEIAEVIAAQIVERSQAALAAHRASSAPAAAVLS